MAGSAGHAPDDGGPSAAGACGVAASAGLAGQPVPNLAAPVLPGQADQRNRAEQAVAVAVLHDRERRAGAGVEVVVAREQPGPRLGLAVRLGQPR